MREDYSLARWTSLLSVGMAVGILLGPFEAAAGAPRDQRAEEVQPPTTRSGSAPAVASRVKMIAIARQLAKRFNCMFSGGKSCPALTTPSAEELRRASAVLERARKTQAAARRAARRVAVASRKDIESAVVALRRCKMEPHGIALSCPAYNHLQKLLIPNEALAQAVGRTYVADANPAIRYAAAQLLQGHPRFLDKRIVVLVLERLNHESHPAVLEQLITVVGGRLRKNAAVRSMLFARAGDKEPLVRAAAVRWLSSTWAKGVPGALDKVLERVRNDSSAIVRALACRSAFLHQDERALPVLIRYMTDPKIGESCAAGVALMWTSPIVRSPSKKAFLALMRFLEKKPRPAQFPPERVLKALDDSHAVSLFDRDRVLRALEDIASERRVSPHRRLRVVDVLRSLGARDHLRRLSVKYRGGADWDGWIGRTIEQSLRSLEPHAGP